MNKRKKKIIIVYGSRTVRGRLLEYQQAPALRTPLAAPKMIEPAVRGRTNRSPRLRRQVLRIFEHMLDLNRPSRPLVRPAPNANGRLLHLPSEVGQAGL